MTNRAVIALLAAVAATVVAVIATISGWPAQPTVRTVGALALILYAVIATGDSVIAHINQVAARLERAGDDRHAEGVIEGMRRAAPPTPGLRGVQ